MKPTYITDLTKEVLTDINLLKEWVENSVDMEFLGLSTEILSNIDLLHRWDCDNVLGIKLASVLSGNLDYRLNNGIEVSIDQSHKFPVETSLYKKIIQTLIDTKATSELIKEEKLKQGFSIEDIERDERRLKASSLLNIIEETEHYSSENQVHFLAKILPAAVKEVKKLDKGFYRFKFKRLSPSVENSITSTTSDKETSQEIADALMPLLNEQRVVLSQPNKDLLTPDEVCELLSIGKTTLWKHTKSGKLKSSGIGNRVYYQREQVLEAIKPINF